MKKTGTKKSKQLGFFAKLNQAFPYHIPRLIGSVVVVLILMVGVLPSKGLGTRSQAKDVPNSKPDVLAVSDKPEAVVGTVEIVTKEAEPELVGVRVPILMYHYIRPMPDCKKDKVGCSLSVPPSVLEEQLQFLQKNGWTTISLDDLSASFKDPKVLPAKPIILTFDDGYSDFYQNAYPLLQRYNMKATNYVLSRGEQLNAQQHYAHYMTSSQLRELAASPLITIAAHTMDHSYLKGRSAQVQHDEISNSKSELEQIIGKPVRHFAYPYGAYDGLSIKYAQDAGFVTAASTLPGTRNNDSTGFTLRRVRIGAISMGWFAAQLTK